MKRLISLVFCLLLLVNSAGSQPFSFFNAKTTNGRLKNSGRDLRVERLAGLARVWGAVKYLHPFPAYREIDWDKALLEAIPQVNAARSAEEYLAALNQMLGALADQNTFALMADANQEPAAPGKQEPAVRFENNILFISAQQGALIGATEGNQVYFKLFDKVVESLPQAAAVVIDGRSETINQGRLIYYFDDFVQTLFRLMLDREVTLGTLRYRLHNGYAPQSGQSSGGFYSSFVTNTPATIRGTFKAKTPPVALIVNDKTSIKGEVLGGLRSAGKILLVQEGEREEPGAASLLLQLQENISVKIRTAELVNPDGSIGLEPDLIVSPSPNQYAAVSQALAALRENRENKGKKSAPALPVLGSAKEKPYAEMIFPDNGHRLLALFRLWNVIRYFYPYKNLLDKSWDDILPEYIPKFEADGDASDYQMTVRELVAELCDSHGSVSGANALADKLGRFAPPLIIDFVEKQTVVTRVLDDKLPVKTGDVVLAIDGERIEKKRAYFARIVSASTAQSAMRRIHAEMLRGQQERDVKLTLRDQKGKTREVIIRRSLNLGDEKFSFEEERGEIIRILPAGFGYVDLTRLQVGDVDRMFEILKKTPAVIFDMRGYPNGTAWSIAPRLTAERNVTGSLISRPLIEAINFDEGGAGRNEYAFSSYLPERRGSVYSGKVVMLIDERAVSQAEHTALFFEAAAKVTFIGTSTAGTNGDVTRTILPGNLNVNFTGQSVRHADGRRLQRIGVEPHLKVERTIRGIVQGKDEILDAAINYLNRNPK